MKRSFLNSFFFTPVFLLIFSGSSMAQSVTGVWITKSVSNTVVELILNADGTGTLMKQPFTYVAANGQLEINDGQEKSYYAYTVTATELSLSDGIAKPLVFQRAAATGNPATSIAPAQPLITNTSLIGKWENVSGSVEFFADGTLMTNGQKYSYTTTATKLTIIAVDGRVETDYTVTATSLTTVYNGVTTVYKRAAAGNVPAATAAGVPGELVGKWCYMSATSAYSGGGSMSDECVVLNANGTYEYHNAYSSSGANGSTASENYDSGTWSVQGNTLMFKSVKGESAQYTFQKQNHPKNNDPMLVIGGKSYVTFYQKQPWK